MEQKNSTHIRAVIGHLRYDTEKELHLINSLYRNELGLYKNFFQPVMKLKEKIEGYREQQYSKRKSVTRFVKMSNNLAAWLRTGLIE